MGIIINNLIHKVMVIGKIKPTATIVAQFAAGVEVEAIQHEGKMYFPVVGMGEFATSDDAPERPAKPVRKSEPVPEVDDEEKIEKEPTKSKEIKSYTKDELMDMESKELVKILKNDYGINPDDFDGKNTNKKLRDLILDAQKDGGKKTVVKEEDDDEDDAPKKGGKKAPAKKDADEDPEEGGEGDELSDQVGDILEDFDAGKKNKKKAIAAIMELSEDADEDKVTELVEKFEDDADADIDETAQEIADVLAGKKPAKKEAAKKSPAKKGKKEKEEELVDVEDLEKGDRVSVWWDDENQDWFDGVVKSIKKGKVVIAYDDDTEDAIDPEVHTKIKRLAE